MDYEAKYCIRQALIHRCGGSTLTSEVQGKITLQIKTRVSRLTAELNNSASTKTGVFYRFPTVTASQPVLAPDLLDGDHGSYLLASDIQAATRSL
jgi:hypothetical protein